MRSGLLLLLSASFAAAQRVNDLTNVFIDVDAKRAVSAKDNVVELKWTDVKRALAKPASVNETTITGYDWTKPFPGKPIDGHGIHLTVGHDVPVPDNLKKNSTTAVTSLTFSIPDSLFSTGDTPEVLDESWWICKHIFISTKATAYEGVGDDGKCGFLSDQCQRDLSTSLTEKWGRAKNTQCGAVTGDPIPRSCVESFGDAKADVLEFDTTVSEDPTTADIMLVNKQVQDDWRVGTGYHKRGDTMAYELAANRTYLVATVWGYSKNVDKDKIATPKVSLACVSPFNSKAGGGSGSGTTTVMTTGSATTGTATGTASTSTSTAAAAMRRYGAIPLLGWF